MGKPVGITRRYSLQSKVPGVYPGSVLSSFRLSGPAVSRIVLDWRKSAPIRITGNAWEFLRKKYRAQGKRHPAQGIIRSLKTSLGGSNQSLRKAPQKQGIFVSCVEFPWFKQATVEQITTIERQSSAHLYWPLLDVDLAVESIRSPALLPLVAKPNPSFQRTR
ncbi:DUF2442 domain-containing protein [Acidithiobacillus thiooxidans]|uniref:DUF2442 domain-containing protein n=1 Tax=Acidithiobacillus thiooxidans TaxID=930 RepID=UPI00111D7C2D|nr:DUF2442 domain-containing protein [Acidithiobacillus thiooxidans]MBE7566531.1 DUF2442 domain-containing protein [Acidithiobacillus sp. HP-11]MBU2740500.1 DUF2442 domain-containing protein [Acidithiobacillus albertensis]MBU2750538.1 DUF2442 domain-containing protein [Acidithiobacillus thiooxidans]MBU2793692.1 DUF2442 domain-containing protein [Acidithiobacillus thiooxidans]